jgi:hypothetical protein
MPQLLTRVTCRSSSVPRKWPVIDRNGGRLHSGMVADFKSEYLAGLNWNPQRMTPNGIGVPKTGLNQTKLYRNSDVTPVQLPNGRSPMWAIW